MGYLKVKHRDDLNFRRIEDLQAAFDGGEGLGVARIKRELTETQPPQIYQYKADVLSIYDGDTMTVLLDLGFGLQLTEKIRLFGIDTPELRGSERPEGIRSRDALKDLLNVFMSDSDDTRSSVYIQTINTRRNKMKTGKYGRLLGIVWLLSEEPPDSMTETGGDYARWLNVNKWMVDQGYAEYTSY